MDHRTLKGTIAGALLVAAIATAWAQEKSKVPPPVNPPVPDAARPKPAGHAAHAPAPKGVDAKADQLLHAMSDTLSGIKALRFTADHETEVVTDAGQKLQQPEASHPIANVLREAQCREHVLHMSAVEEFEPAKLDEGDVAPREFHLQRPAMVAGSE